MAPINRKELQAYTHLELLAKQVVEGFITGLHQSPFHGFSVEFAEHRLYNTGESTRHLDWKLLARTDKYFVKRFEEETNLRCRIIIDTSSSMYFPTELIKDHKNKLGFSIYAAAALIELLKRQRDAFGLSLFDEEVHTHTQAKSSQTHQHLVYQSLEALMGKEQLDKKSSLVTALHEIAERIHQRSMVVVFSDMMDNSERHDELISALQHLKHNKHEVLLFHVHSKSKELDFEYEQRPYRFVDMESGEVLKLNPNEVKENYVKEMRARRDALKLRCGQFGVEYIEANIEDGFHQVLLPFLIQRKKMG